MGDDAVMLEVEEVEAPAEAPDVEIIREGAEGSQPDKQSGIRKRVNKLNAKVDAAEGQAQAANSELELERERSRLLTLALEQAKEGRLKPPDAMDFDDGADDPKYVEGLNAYNRKIISEEVQRQIPVAPAPTNPESERVQTKHYERAQELGAKDYEETEDKVIGILGNDVVRNIIESSENSHILMYYLGKNPDRAEEIKQLIDTNPVMATMRLGRLEAELKVRPKGDVEPAPDPDTELQGGSPSSHEHYEIKLKMLRDKATVGGREGSKAMRDIIDLKKRMKGGA